MKTGVEPLWRIGRAHLHRQHETMLVIKGEGVVLGGEIATFPAPIGPAACKAVKHLLGAHFGTVALIFGQFGEGFFISNRTPQPRRNAGFFNLLQHCGHTGFAEIFLRKHIGGHLGPRFGNLDIFQTKHHRTIGVTDLTGRMTENKRVIR